MNCEIRISTPQPNLRPSALLKLSLQPQTAPFRKPTLNPGSFVPAPYPFPRSKALEAVEIPAGKSTQPAREALETLPPVGPRASRRTACPTLEPWPVICLTFLLASGYGDAGVNKKAESLSNGLACEICKGSQCSCFRCSRRSMSCLGAWRCKRKLRQGTGLSGLK